MDTSDFVFYKDDNNQIISGGYIINSNLLNKNGGFEENIMNTYITENNINETDKNNEQKGGKKYDNYAVPAGLFFINQRVTKSSSDNGHYNYKDHNMLPDNIHDKLLELIGSNVKHNNKSNKKNTKKNNKKNNKKTKKNKN